MKTSKRKLLISMMIPALAILSFIGGNWLGTRSFAARELFTGIETSGIQAGTDAMVRQSGLDTERLIKLSGEPNLTRSVIAALQGNNPSLNPSNEHFVAFDENRMKDGLPVNPLGQPYVFRIVLQHGNNLTNADLRLLVSSAHAGTGAGEIR
jgi:hypothetical protein